MYRASFEELHVRRSRKDRSARGNLWVAPCLMMLCGVLGCASGKPAPTVSQACVPGDQKACACPGRPDGVQVCVDDGSRYDTCTGCAPTATGGSTGSPGTGGANGTSGTGGSPGTGGRGTGGATDAGAGLGDVADASTPIDAPLDTTDGAVGADGSAGAPGGDGGGVDGGARDEAGVDGPGADSGGIDGAGDAAATGVVIAPDRNGLVLASSNTLGAQGPWYSYGDGVGADGAAATGICELRGGHPASACSTILTPAVGSFPNTGGRMCTSGTAAVIIAGAGGLPDYANITGAGIGLDLNNSGGAVPVRGVFNATIKRVTGLAFDLEISTLTALRVEFPTPATDLGAAGAAYWGANPAFSDSPVVAGTNVLRWAEVRIAGAAPPAFDPTMIESILFHVPTNRTSAVPYSFCISNLRLLTN